jgi:hypothetical protein
MKQYLMLVPDAKDARSAQDRIYEWEIMMEKWEKTDEPCCQDYSVNTPAG